MKTDYGQPIVLWLPLVDLFSNQKVEWDLSLQNVQEIMGVFDLKYAII